MTLAPLHVKITGDSNDAILASARLSNKLREMEGHVKRVSNNMQKLGPSVRTSLRGATADADKFSKGLKSSRFHSANLFAQINDIGVMMASGQNPLILMVQQGTQVTQVFQAMGGTAKQQLGALFRAFTIMLKPMNLFIIAAIGATAALGQWGIKALSAEEDATALEDAIKELNDELERGSVAITQYTQGLDNLAQARVFEKMVSLQDEINDITKEIAEVESARRPGYARDLKNLRAQLDARKAEFDEMQKLLRESQAMTDAVELAKEEAKALEEVLQLLPGVLDHAAGNAARLSDAFKEAREEAREFMKLQELRSRFAGEEIVMGQDVLQPGRGEPPPKLDEDKTGTRRGGAGRDPRADIERLQEQLMTELELERHMYEEKQKIIDDALAKELIAKEQAKEMEQRLTEDHAKKIRDIELAIQSERLNNLSGMFSDFSSLMNTNSRKLFEIGKTAGIASAIIDTYNAINKALATHPPPLSYAYAAASAAKGFASVQAIQSQSFSRGGSGGAGGGAGAIAAVPQEAAAGPSRPSVSLTLIGNEGFSRAQIVQIAEALNDSGEDGNELVSIRGRR